jgi:cytochrome P450
LQTNVFILTLAGSETTATLLSGALFLIASRPKVLNRLYDEVRSSFDNANDITLTSVNRLEYMLACLDESLRMYPPVPGNLPRVVPKGGQEIAGHWVAENTSVAIWQWAINYCEDNFTDPEEFHPERFMSDERFAKDDLNARQPFSVGSRNCIGKTLAYAEMRLIAARILYSFDIGLAPGAEDWIKNQKVYALWDKPELPMYLTPIHKTA